VKKILLLIALIALVLALSGCTDGTEGQALKPVTKEVLPDDGGVDLIVVKCLNGGTVECDGTNCRGADAREEEDGSFYDGYCTCDAFGSYTQCPSPLSK